MNNYHMDVARLLVLSKLDIQNLEFFVGRVYLNSIQLFQFQVNIDSVVWKLRILHFCILYTINNVK